MILPDDDTAGRFLIKYPQTVSIYRILAFESLRIRILDLASIHKVSMYPCVGRASGAHGETQGRTKEGTDCLY